jgi:hypothetical protein
VRANRVLINVPPEHAKSYGTITTNYVVYKIVTNPNARVIIVSKTQGMARKFLGAIKTRLSHPAYHQVADVAFGPNGGYKADSTQWSADMIYLGTGRDSGEKDPTVQALGMGSQIYGARADLIIIDDAVMGSNAHEWEKQLEWIQKEVITRLGRHGKLIIVGTRVAPIDLYKMLRDPQVSGLVASRPLLTLQCLPYFSLTRSLKTGKRCGLRPLMQENEIDEPDENGLYPKWDGPSLFTRRSEVAASVWAMVYQQEDVQSDSIFSPTAVAGCVNGMRKRGPLKPGTPGHPRSANATYTVIGFDPAVSGRSALWQYLTTATMARIYVLDCVNMADPTPQKENALIREWVEKIPPSRVSC